MLDPIRVEELFFAAIELSTPEERAAYLDDACRDQPELRQRVDLLVAGHFKTHGFLDSPSAASPVPSDFSPNPSGNNGHEKDLANRGTREYVRVPSETIGSRIGPYKLLQQLGEGGMGTVYMAEQEQPVKRRVALKIIKTGMDSAQIVARFEQERQALAMMDHPNIAKVLDAGATETGRPYFVMELVKGIPITRFCDQEHLTPQERLELFMPVCQAVQHAHQKGIIHRDLKPSNVLIALYDGKAVPKVIDFGVAKATHQKLTERTMFTEVGSIVGTLEYMAPEQAELNNLDIDTRADIYSLGVLLYELLTGGPPFSAKQLRGAAFTEMLRMIREVEPPKPSTRLSSSDELPAIAANRKLEPRRLTSLVTGELDWIVMKALEKDRGRRYETANGLAMDIGRYLSDEPVLASPPSAAYRMKKFARRNRGPVAAAVGLLAALSAGVVGTSIGLVRAENARKGETQQRQVAQAREEEALAEKAKALEAAQQERLAKERESDQRRLAEDERGRAEQREQEAIDAVKRFGDAVANNPDLKNSPQLEALRKTLLKEPLGFFKSLRERLQADLDTRSESLARLASAAFDLGHLTDQIGDKQDALRAFGESLAIFQRLARENPTVTEFQRDLAASHNEIGLLLSETGKPAEALAAFEQALAIHQQLARENPTVTNFQSELAGSHGNIGLLLHDTGKPAEALAAYERALAIQERLARENPTVTKFQSHLARTHNNIGVLLHETGKPAEALAAFEQALAIHQRLERKNPTVIKFQSELADSHNNIGVLLRDTGKPAEALAAHEQALAIQERLARENPTVTEFQRDLAVSHNNIGILLHDTGNPTKALAAFEQVLAIRQRLSGENPTVTKFQADLAVSHYNIGLLFSETGKPAEALAACKQALAIQERLARENPTVTKFQHDLAGSHGNIGALLHITGRLAEALAAYERELAIWERLVRANPTVVAFQSELARTLNNLALLDLDAQRFSEARVRLREAIVYQQTALAANPRHPTYRQILTNSYNELLKAALGLNDATLADEARRGLAQIAAGDPRFAALDERLAAVLGGEAAKDAAELLALGQRAHDLRRYALAARWSGEVLERDATLADDRQTQPAYNAACCAALAGSGQGLDDPPTDETTRAKLRGQALIWLRAELDRWTGFLQTATPERRQIVSSTLKHWQTDSDLAGLRDAAELARLPAEEQQGCTQLWADVAALLKKAEVNPE